MTNWRCEEEAKMKLIAILLSIIIMEAPSSMTSSGPFYISKRSQYVFRQDISQVPSKSTLALSSLLT